MKRWNGGFSGEGLLFPLRLPRRPSPCIRFFPPRFSASVPGRQAFLVQGPALSRLGENIPFTRRNQQLLLSPNHLVSEIRGLAVTFDPEPYYRLGTTRSRVSGTTLLTRDTNNYQFQTAKHRLLPRRPGRAPLLLSRASLRWPVSGPHRFYPLCLQLKSRLCVSRRIPRSPTHLLKPGPLSARSNSFTQSANSLFSPPPTMPAACPVARGLKDVID